MANESLGVPERAGDLAELGLEQRKPLILPADDEIEAAKEPEETQPAQEPEQEEEQPSILEKYIESQQPTKQEDKTDRELELERRLARQEAQLEQFLRDRDREIASKADAAGKEEEQGYDLGSEVFAKYLSEIDDPVERERIRMRMIDEKLKADTEKRYSGFQSTLEQTRQEMRQESASREFQAQVQTSLDQIAQTGDVERQLVEQWNSVPREQRKNTLIGRGIARNPMIAFSPEALGYLVKGLARDIETRMKTGTIRQPVTETTGASSKASSRSRELTKKPVEPLSAEQELWQKIKGLGSLGEDLDWMK